jgi:hypothetical protein
MEGWMTPDGFAISHLLPGNLLRNIKRITTPTGRVSVRIKRTKEHT